MSNYENPPFERTVCACERCTACCKKQPGPLVLGDMERIARHLQIPLEEAKDFFRASPGALVKDLTNNRTYRVGTIVPRRQKGGACVFLKDGLCSIHPVAPMGCSHFDTHMGFLEGQKRSRWILSKQVLPEYQALRNQLKYAEVYKPTWR